MHIVIIFILCFRRHILYPCEFAAVPNFIIQGGDITDDNGVGGESIYGGYFEDETFEVLHNKLYLLNMANKGPDTVS